MGDSQSTWFNGKTYWPDLLAADNEFHGASICLYQYPTSSFRNTIFINEVADNMRLIFSNDGVDNYKNIVFLAHWAASSFETPFWNIGPSQTILA